MWRRAVPVVSVIWVMLLIMANAEPVVEWQWFKTNIYTPAAQMIIEQMTPCGCSARTAVPPLPQDNVAKEYIDFTLLNRAFFLLVDLAGSLAAGCQCLEGQNFATATQQATPYPSSDDAVTANQALGMSNSVRTFIDGMILRCCDASKSDKNYIVVDGRFTLEEAVQDAKNRGGQVASLRTRDECWKASQVLRGTGGQPALGADADSLHFVWLGLVGTPPSDLSSNINFVWLDTANPTLTFTNWAKGQPVSATCGAFTVTPYYGVYSTWAAVNCSSRLPYLLQQPKGAATDGRGSNSIIIIAIAVLLGLFVVASTAILARRFLPCFRKSSSLSARPGGGDASPSVTRRGRDLDGQYTRRRLATATRIVRGPEVVTTGAPGGPRTSSGGSSGRRHRRRRESDSEEDVEMGTMAPLGPTPSSGAAAAGGGSFGGPSPGSSPASTPSMGVGGMRTRGPRGPTSPVSIPQPSHQAAFRAGTPPVIVVSPSDRSLEGTPRSSRGFAAPAAITALRLDSSRRPGALPRGSRERDAGMGPRGDTADSSGVNDGSSSGDGVFPSFPIRTPQEDSQSYLHDSGVHLAAAAASSSSTAAPSDVRTRDDPLMVVMFEGTGGVEEQLPSSRAPSTAAPPAAVGGAAAASAVDDGTGMMSAVSEGSMTSCASDVHNGGGTAVVARQDSSIIDAAV